MIQLVGNLSERMYRYRIEYLKNKGVYEGLIKEHSDIIRYIEGNNPSEARAAIRKHITNQVEKVSLEIKAGKEKK